MAEIAVRHVEVQRFFECTIPPHRSYGLFELKFHLLDHFLSYSERFGNFSSLQVAPFDRFKLLKKIVR